MQQRAKGEDAEESFSSSYSNSYSIVAGNEGGDKGLQAWAFMNSGFRQLLREKQRAVATH